MLDHKIKYLLYGFFITIITACGGDDDDIPVVEKDTIKPSIDCIDNIESVGDANGTVVTYTTPVGTDNLSGAVTIQTEGLKSGALFPIGTTTNTFQVTDKAGNKTSCSFQVIVSISQENQPYSLNNGISIPSGKKWVKVENLSDEFDNETLDQKKWASRVSTWVGRVPAIFKDEAISIKEGNLLITNYMLDAAVVVNGNTYTHAGGLIRSLEAAAPGMYLECRMKANKTFMSSTFWLINNRNDGTGCDKRTTELDIQECVGEVTTDANWASNFDSGMHSNTHSRNTECLETKTGSVGNTSSGSLTYEDYHVYAAWWKSPTEILFYLDGELQKTVTPAEEFNLPMYCRLVTETYDWNPAPTNGGLTGSAEERTTKYDWVRTWKLEDN